jgi:hypothetical protein
MGKDIFLIDVLFFFKAIFEYKSTQTSVYLKLRISVVGKNGVRLDEPHFGLGSDLVILIDINYKANTSHTIGWN